MSRSSNSDIPLDLINHGDQPQLYNLIDSTSVEDSIPGGWKCTRKDETGTRTLYPSLSNNPRALYRLISDQHQLPPRQYVDIKGLKDKGKDSKEINFNVKLDLTSTLLRLGKGEVLTEGNIQRLRQRAQERMGNLASFLPERNVTGDSMAESEQAAGHGLTRPGMGPRGYTFQAEWGGNSNSTNP
ncbi:hypothetical protein N7463_002491 [Penicillium fimorum]|uniref:Uncharacterized protein n=1 Tax=Penicillium fimorum TaxID=1882269 RepID=A0A9W9Y0T5_9EURO|nr:hypothetical protein N7463_002491 [Penicillium fimorum]